MSGAQQVRNTIVATKKTAQITKAMELVAASKLGKSQQRCQVGKPYAEKILEVIGHLAHCHSEYKHPFLAERPHPKRSGYMVIGTDRGLCGSLNIQLFKAVIESMRSEEAKGLGRPAMSLIGQKTSTFFRRMPVDVVGEVQHLGDQPALGDLVGVIKLMLDAFKAGEIDRVYLASNVYVNTMVQKPTLIQLLPLVRTDLPPKVGRHWDYLYEPDAQAIMDGLLTRYIESLVYQGMVENLACEQAARMLAMKSATDNAQDIIRDLQLTLNKLRQASITKELAEICSGADAV